MNSVFIGRKDHTNRTNFTFSLPPGKNRVNDLSIHWFRLAILSAMQALGGAGIGTVAIITIWPGNNLCNVPAITVLAQLCIENTGL